MTRLLVSVRDAWEAGEAVAGGADVIDVKEPRFGSLGAASPETWNAVRLTVQSTDSNPHLPKSGARAPVTLSAALGELLEDRWTTAIAWLNGYAYAKVGLAGCAAVDGWEQRWRAWMTNLPDATAPVAVIYADYKCADAPIPWRVLEAATRSPARTLLVDTFDKSAGDIFQRMASCELLEIINAGQSAGFQVALAGSITLERLADALEFQPDWIAVRGAVCRAGRESTLERNLVERLAKRLSTPFESDLAPSRGQTIDYGTSGT